MNAEQWGHNAACANLSSASFNGTQPLFLTDVASCQFWSIVHNDVLLYVSVVLIVIFFSFSLVVNIYLLLGLENSEALSWQPRYMLLKNLIVSDLLQSLTLAPSMLYCLLCRQTLSFGAWCLAQLFVATLVIITSLLTVFFMVLERFVYICHGIHYLSIMTNVRMYICLILIWLLALMVAASRIFLVMSGQPRLGHNIPGFVCEPGVVQVQIVFSLRFEMFNKATMVTFLLFAVFVFSFSYGRMYQEARQALQPFQQDNVCARRTVAFYLGIFVLQLIPSAFKFATMFHEEVDYHLLLVLLFMVPPCVNPLAYGFRNREVRQALQHLRGIRMTGRQPVSDWTLSVSAFSPDS
ncbi:olfactory receptor 2AG1-like [Salminus brasiliensis]|uniref:olfactory receptor 2AG1-like n=1 Tax=Salminus brasiliensis TaxID=930266 RepID=UPI003B830600